MNDPHILCLRCRSVFTEAQIEGHQACPTCGDKGVPGDTRLKAALTLTHHEWRILFMWAENWAAYCSRQDEQFVSPIPGIIRDAHKQAPDLPGLTLMEEVQEVANKFGKVTVHQGEETTDVEPETKH